MTKKLLETKSEIEIEITRIASEHPEAKSIVIFAPSLSWSGQLFQRPQQMARALAKKGALVFYVQPGGIWPAWFVEIEPNLILCQTPLDVFHVLPRAFVYALPWNLGLLVHFMRPSVIYDYLDDLSVFYKVPNVQKQHHRYLRQAEIVITSAWRLLEEVRHSRPDVLFLPNAADVDHFSRPVPVPPDDLKPILSIGKPILGYHGALARWFDYSLVREIARSRQNISIVLIGPDHDSSIHHSHLLEEPNIYWLGAKTYDQLPDYVAHFDVGFIPFVVNEITDATSPIKLFEYFAAGKPVIVSPMQESKRYSHVLIANNIEEWGACIDLALQKSIEPDFRQELRRFALENSWEKRASELLEKISSKSPQKIYAVRISTMETPLQRLARLFVKAVRIARTTGIRGLLRSIYYKSHDLWSRYSFLLGEHLFSSWKDRYFLEDNSIVTLYTNSLDLYPEYQPRRPLPDFSSSTPKVTVISTCKNEENSVEQWMACLAKQTLQPAEIIVVDAGSTDGTVERLHVAAQKYHLPLRVIRQAGVSIAAGRNLAIREASSPIIASVDFGCRPSLDWLQKIVFPFQADPHTEIVAGWYRPITSAGKESRLPGWPKLEQLSPTTFIPSSRSLAFTKAAWEKIGGYPEWLTLTGEDTYFALEGKRLCHHWAFVPDAIVEWEAPSSWYQLWQKAKLWATGDGEIGYNAWLFRRILFRTICCLIAILIGAAGIGTLCMLGLNQIYTAGWLALSLVLLISVALGAYSWIRWRDIFYLPGMLGLNLAQLVGFWEGARRQKTVTLRSLEKSKGVFFILAGPPIEDTGGGSRAAQLALELLRHGYWVVYIHRYPSYETQRVPVPIAHPHLFCFNLLRFSWTKFKTTYASVIAVKPKAVITEFPSADFLPLLSSLKEEGSKIVYEMIDDWNTSLGGHWYSPEIEQKFIQSSDILIGTAPPLQEKLNRMSSRTAHLLPNAVNRYLFNPKRPYPRPADLPDAEWLAIYIGALWGEWFDWDLLTALAQRYPNAAFVVIGDYRGQHSNPPPNLKFLGLRPQRALPAYLYHVDVGILPWKISAITQATSPLKVYEYLAMHRPVVAPNLIPLRGIPGVFLAKDTEEFLKLVARVRKTMLDVEAVEAFIRQNDWSTRVRQLLEWLNL